MDRRSLLTPKKETLLPDMYKPGSIHVTYSPIPTDFADFQRPLSFSYTFKCMQVGVYYFIDYAFKRGHGFNIFTHVFS